MFFPESLDWDVVKAFKIRAYRNKGLDVVFWTSSLANRVPVEADSFDVLEHLKFSDLCQTSELISAQFQISEALEPLYTRETFEVVFFLG